MLQSHPMLKEFWFPVLLALAGLIVAGIAMSTDEYVRRWLWTLASLCWFLAVLAFLWGDPVRGPFARLVTKKQEFVFHAGINIVYPVEQLKDGVDFNNMIRLPDEPIKLTVRKTWWSGYHWNMALRLSTGYADIVKENHVVSELPDGLDVNSDENAIEVVNSQQIPIVQVIQDGDYDFHLNAIIPTDTGFMILKDNRMFSARPDKMTRDAMLVRLFKYPAYANRGKRE